MGKMMSPPRIKPFRAALSDLELVAICTGAPLTVWVIMTIIHPISMAMVRPPKGSAHSKGMGGSLATMPAIPPSRIRIFTIQKMMPR